MTVLVMCGTSPRLDAQSCSSIAFPAALDLFSPTLISCILQHRRHSIKIDIISIQYPISSTDQPMQMRRSCMRTFDESVFLRTSTEVSTT
jgi:hypothetical protein